MLAADLSDFDGIVTVGGDGILYEVVNGLRCRIDSKQVSNVRKSHFLNSYVVSLSFIALLVKYVRQAFRLYFLSIVRP